MLDELTDLKLIVIDESFIDFSDYCPSPSVADLAAEHTNVIVMKSLGKNLGLEVIAEGVETEAQLDYVREHGCDTAQGYLYARPEPVDVVTPWLKDNQRVSSTNIRSIPIAKGREGTGN